MPIRSIASCAPASACRASASLQLDEKVGLHDKLAPLMDSWKAGDLAIVQGVGYPYPNRSHFRSIEIWDTASASSQTLSEGWVAQAFKGAELAQGRRRRQHRGRHQRAARRPGPSLRTIVMQDAENFLRQAKAIERRSAHGRRRQSGAAIICWPCGRRSTPRRPACATSCATRRRRPKPIAQELLLGRQLDLATRILSAQRAGGGHQGGAGRLRHPRQPGADARAAAGVPGVEPRDACART